MDLWTGLNHVHDSLTRPFRVFNLIELSRSALLANYDLYQALLPDHKIIPVLKADAYGHGLSEIADITRDRQPPYVAVDSYQESLALERVGGQSCLIMGAIHPDNYANIKTKNRAFVVQDLAAGETLGKTKRSVKVHLEINTGMHRQGIELKELGRYIDLLHQYQNIELEGVMTHPADADGDDDNYTQAQVREFDKAVKRIQSAGLSPKYIHMPQSAGVLTIKSQYTNTLRMGMALYGINPFPADHKKYKALTGLEPVMSIKSTIVKTHQLKKGDRVSYNGIFTAPRAMRIGILPLGYYEGIPRILSNRGVVIRQGKELPIVGRICMNHTIISLEGSDAGVGDEVIVISSKTQDPNSWPTIFEEFGLFSYETLVHVAPTTRRVIVH